MWNKPLSYWFLSLSLSLPRPYQQKDFPPPHTRTSPLRGSLSVHHEQMAPGFKLMSACCKSMLHCRLNLFIICLYYYFILFIWNLIYFFRIFKSQFQSAPQVTIQLRSHGPNSSSALDTREYSWIWWRPKKCNINGSWHWGRLCWFLDVILRNSRK